MRDPYLAADNPAMVWLGLSAAMVLAIAGLWWWSWRQRNRKPPKPTRPYREWKD